MVNMVNCGVFDIHSTSYKNGVEGHTEPEFLATKVPK